MGNLRLQMQWHINDLYLRKRKSGFSIEPAGVIYPHMWRVRKPDGTLTDMVNLSRAKDAAMVLLERQLDGIAVRPR
jgi:hypothetical protein